MGRPGELVSDLVEPVLHGLESTLPDVGVRIESAMARNPRLRLLRAELRVQSRKLAAARLAGYGSGAGMGFHVPRRFSPCDALNRNELRSTMLWQEKALREAESQVRLRVSEMARVVAQKRLELGADRARLDYRELYLDRSRAIYELGFRTDLGDATVQMTGADAQYWTTHYDLAMALHRLEAMTGLELRIDAAISGG